MSSMEHYDQDIEEVFARSSRARGSDGFKRD